MFQGSMVALVTPMKADNTLDWDALHKLVDWHLQEGTHALVPMGTTGESPPWITKSIWMWWRQWWIRSMAAYL